MESEFEYLKETVGPEEFDQWQEVEVEICGFTDLGIKVSINDEYAGLVYRTQVYEKYYEGQRLKAYIQCVREDGKIDVTFQPSRGVSVHIAIDKILEHLKAAGGKSEFNDKSSPEDIKEEFQVSKKIFKQALGNLYKQGKVIITDNGIELV